MRASRGDRRPGGERCDQGRARRGPVEPIGRRPASRKRKPRGRSRRSPTSMRAFAIDQARHRRIGAGAVDAGAEPERKPPATACAVSCQPLAQTTRRRKEQEDRQGEQQDPQHRFADAREHVDGPRSASLRRPRGRCRCWRGGRRSRGPPRGQRLGRRPPWFLLIERAGTHASSYGRVGPGLSTATRHHADVSLKLISAHDTGAGN